MMKKVQLLQSNIDKLKLLPCTTCGTFNESEYIWGQPENNGECAEHWIEVGPRNFTHFSIRGKWYVLPQKMTTSLLSLVEVDAAMQIQGAMYRPKPTRIENLTNLMALVRTLGVTAEQMTKAFPDQQVKRMTGRVLKRLVKGR